MFGSFWLLVIAVVLGLAVVLVFAFLIWGRMRGWKAVTPPDKTVWDFVYLAGVFAIPFVVLFVAAQFSQQQNNQQQSIEDDRIESQQRIEDERAEAAQELAEQSARDNALQAYLDQMSALLLEYDLRSSEEGSEVRTLTRARTLAVLQILDRSGRTQVMQFLIEAELVQGVDGRDPTIELSGADLSDAELSGADLSDADLPSADLSGARLTGAHLGEADLENIRGITPEELHQQAASLEEATMPNGQKYEEWLRNREGRGEDGENSNP